MEDISVFTEKDKQPTEKDLAEALGKTSTWWNTIEQYVFEKYPQAAREWFYSGAKYGWNYRLKDKKRAIVYLLPRKGKFKVGLMFGQKATDAVMVSPVSQKIKDELATARPYVEGRGIRIDIDTLADIENIKLLIDIKLTY
jgi:hypothetical protein